MHRHIEHVMFDWVLLQLLLLNSEISQFSSCIASRCCGQPWKWHLFRKWTCDGLCRLQLLSGFRWNIKSSFKLNPGPLSDTLQAGAWLFLPFQKWLNMLTHVAFLQFLPSGQYGLCFGYCFSGPIPLRSNKEQVTFSGPFLGVFYITLEIGQNHLSIEAQCDQHTRHAIR